MPTYEYRCDACESEFEVEKRMSDPVEAGCPDCGSDRTHRLISHTSFVLKGSGWYVTDYARKNGNGGNGGTHGKPVADGKKDADRDGPKNGGSDAPAAPAAAPATTPAAPSTPAPAASAPAATPSSSPS